MTRASLVVPTYNRADLIGETLESALAQTRSFAEIIVVDDGSTDRTPAVLDGFAGRIKVIRTDNRGVQAARNTGVAAASCAIVSLCDSDDLLEAEFVATVPAWLDARHDIDIVYSNFWTFDASGRQPDKFSQAPGEHFQDAVADGAFLTAVPELYRKVIAFQPLFVCGLTFRKDFFQRIGGYAAEMRGVPAEDFEFTLRAISSGRVALCRTPLSRVRKHGGNDSRDSMMMNIGEAKILEHSLAHHSGAARFSAEILRSVNERRLAAFDLAFARGEFQLAADVLRELHREPGSAKFQIKKRILSLPAALRAPLWRITQL